MAYLEMSDNPETENIWEINWTIYAFAYLSGISAATTAYFNGVTLGIGTNNFRITVV